MNSADRSDPNIYAKIIFFAGPKVNGTKGFRIFGGLLGKSENLQLSFLVILSLFERFVPIFLLPDLLGKGAIVVKGAMV
jgi:hypothetical protein